MFNKNVYKKVETNLQPDGVLNVDFEFPKGVSEGIDDEDITKDKVESMSEGIDDDELNEEEYEEKDINEEDINEAIRKLNELKELKQKRLGLIQQREKEMAEHKNLPTTPINNPEQYIQPQPTKSNQTPPPVLSNDTPTLNINEVIDILEGNLKRNLLLLTYLREYS